MVAMRLMQYWLMPRVRNQVYDSGGLLQKLLPNLRIFYEFVMFMTVI